ncbi:MAG: hypothetical protein DPW13_05870 [Planctomycetes bacterium]|nr:hypothetical protein [Planctomycetota bacterium]
MLLHLKLALLHHATPLRQQPVQVAFTHRDLGTQIVRVRFRAGRCGAFRQGVFELIQLGLKPLKLGAAPLQLGNQAHIPVFAVKRVGRRRSGIRR